jgi:hypothetical protein
VKILSLDGGLSWVGFRYHIGVVAEFDSRHYQIFCEEIPGISSQRASVASYS